MIRGVIVVLTTSRLTNRSSERHRAVLLMALVTFGRSLRFTPALTGAVAQLLSVRRLRCRSELNVRFWSFIVRSVRMSRTSPSVDPGGSTEDDSTRDRRAATVPPNKSLERTAPRRVVDGVIYIWTGTECYSGAGRCRRSALIR